MLIFQTAWAFPQYRKTDLGFSGIVYFRDMKITEETVERIAELAKLEFTDEEKKAIMGDMNKILSFMDKLNELDTEGVEPLIYMTPEVNALRKDEVIQTLTHEEALKNAPKKDSDYFRVPKVLERKS